MDILCNLLQIYVWVVIGRIILEWVPVPADHPVGQFRRMLATATDPALQPLRRVLPPLRAGAMAIDLSPLVLIFGLQILAGVICN